MSSQTPARREEVDPGILELIGTATELLGLAEHIQRFLPFDRLRMAKKHRRIQNLLERIRSALEDGRAAMRIISSSVTDRVHDMPEGAIGFPLERSELPVYRRGLDQLHVAIRSMTNAALELESVTIGMSDEVQRYHRISSSGLVVLEKLRETMHGPPTLLPRLLVETERYLTKCSEIISEATHWREF